MLKKCTQCPVMFEGRPDKKTCSVKCRMAKSRGRGVKLALLKVKRGDTKHKGSCVTTAISHATGISFQEVEKLLIAAGRKGKSGCRMSVWQPVVEKLGFEEVIEARRYLLDDVPCKAGVWYLAAVRQHMVAVLDGKYYDLPGGEMKRRKRLISLWRRTK